MSLDLDKPPWIPVDPLMTNHPGSRSPEQYRVIVSQFEVEKLKRYQPQAGKTFCNIFVWDVTAAMGCEIPHWYNDVGEPVPVGRGREMTANDMRDWLKKEGPTYGWEPCSSVGAVEHASEGRPTVAVWKNAGGTGHCAVVLPGGGLHIAQAGATCFFDRSIQAGFGSHTPAVEYYWHA